MPGQEIDYRGSLRFVDEITDGVRALAHTFHADDAYTAFETALDPSVAGKVLLSFR